MISKSLLTPVLNDLKEIMNIPDNYKIIFVQGGASLQFAGVPLNLMKNKKVFLSHSPGNRQKIQTVIITHSI